MNKERFFAVKTTCKNYKNQTIIIPLFVLLVSVLIFSCNSKKILADTQVVKYYQPQYSGNELFQKLTKIDDDSIDIAEVSLLIAKEEYPEIEIWDYVECVDWYARMLKARISEVDGPKAIIEIINEFLFDELGFKYVQTGNLEDLYLNEVIDRRKGNCVGLSIL